MYLLIVLFASASSGRALGITLACAGFVLIDYYFQPPYGQVAVGKPLDWLALIAFLVTAQSLGIPTRMVLNEAHAWVEVHDGVLWRRIDLGGAGHMAPASNAIPERAAYRPPPDSFSWPQNAQRGDDMVAEARAAMAEFAEFHQVARHLAAARTSRNACRGSPG